MKEISIKIYKLLSSSYLAKSASFLAFAQIISGGTNFFLLSIFTKHLSPNDFGKISLIWIFVTVTTIIVDSGMNTAFSIKFFKTTQKERSKNLFTIFIYYFIGLCVLFLMFQIIPKLFQNLIRVNLSVQDLNIIFVLIMLMLFGNFYTNILIIEKKPKHYFIIKLTFNIILILSSLIYLLVLKSDYFSYIKVYLIAYFVITCLGVFYLFIKYNFRSIRNISFFNLKSLVKLGVPLVPNFLLLMFLTWGDRYILDIYSGLAAIGIYTVGYRFSEVINHFVIQPFSSAISPVLFEKYANSKAQYKELLEKIFKYYWIVTFGIIIVYFVVLKEAFLILINPDYIEGYNIISIIVLGVIMWGITNLITVTIIMKEQTNKVSTFTLLSVIINFGLNFILIPKFNIYGAAIATFISYFIQFIIVFRYTQRLFKITYDFKYVFKSILISLFFFSVIIFISYLPFHYSIVVLIKTLIATIYLWIIYNYFGVKKMISEKLHND